MVKKIQQLLEGIQHGAKQGERAAYAQKAQWLSEKGIKKGG